MSDVFLTLPASEFSPDGAPVGLSGMQLHPTALLASLTNGTSYRAIAINAEAVSPIFTPTAPPVTPDPPTAAGNLPDVILTEGTGLTFIRVIDDFTGADEWTVIAGPAVMSQAGTDVVIDTDATGLLEDVTITVRGSNDNGQQFVDSSFVLDVVAQSSGTIPIVGNPPSLGDFTATLDASPFDLTIATLAEFAGTFNIDPADLGAGPVNYRAPSTDGPGEGDTATARTGQWCGDEADGAIGFDLQWKRGPGSGLIIPGASGAQRTLSFSDVLQGLSLDVTASNGAGSRAVNVPVQAPGPNLMLDPMDPNTANWAGTLGALNFTTGRPDTLGGTGAARYTSTSNSDFAQGTFDQAAAPAQGTRTTWWWVVKHVDFAADETLRMFFCEQSAWIDIRSATPSVLRVDSATATVTVEPFADNPAWTLIRFTDNLLIDGDGPRFAFTVAKNTTSQKAVGASFDWHEAAILPATAF